MFAPVFCEFLEVAFHNILYVRNIYPESAFVKRKKYNVPVWKAVHPDVCSYIEKCVTGINKLLVNNEVQKVVFAVLDFSGNPVEQYVFELSLPSVTELSDESKFLLDVEEAFRSFCLRIGTSSGLLHPNPEGYNFSIQMHTKEITSISMSLSDDVDFQNFPWIEADKREEDVTNGSIIPLKAMDCHMCKMQMYVVEGNKDQPYINHELVHKVLQPSGRTGKWFETNFGVRQR